MNIDTNTIVSIVRTEEYCPFDLFIDHFNNKRIDIFLTRIDYRIGELQYIKGSIRFDENYSYGLFTSNLADQPIVVWQDQIDTNQTTANSIINALKTCIESIR